MGPPAVQQIILSTIIVIAFGLLLTERLRMDIVALLIIFALAVTRILTPDEAFSGLASEPAVIVAAIFVLSRSLELTGLSDLIARGIVRLSGDGQSRLLSVMMLTASVLSAFSYHLTTTATMMPVLLKLSRERNIPASKLLMPLSFAASLGVTLTIVAAPSFLLARTLLQQAGRPALAFFSVTPIGACLVALGALYVLIVGRFLLPARRGHQSSEALFRSDSFFTELTILPNSRFAGSEIDKLKNAELHSLDVVKWLRNGQAVRTPFKDHVLEPGDLLLVNLSPDELATLRQQRRGIELKPIEQFGAPVPGSEGPGEELSAHMVQAVVMPGSQLAGSTIAASDLQQRYGVVALGLSRQGEPASQEIDHIPLRVGDVLVLEGDEEELLRLTQDQSALLLTPFTGQPQAYPKLRLAAAIMAGTIGLAASRVLPIEVAMLAGALAMVLSGCITVRQAYTAIDTRIFLFIAGAVPLGLAMQKTGAADRVAAFLQAGMAHWPQALTLFVLFAVSAVITQPLSDAATLAVFGPVAIALAHALGQPPEAYVLAVAFAAVVAFITPIGHLSNLLVFGPGGYRFSDFVKVGTPLTILAGLVVAWLTPLVFS